jgi:methionine-rich copper-binding protein CopC
MGVRKAQVKTENDPLEKYLILLKLGYFSLIMKNHINTACSKLALTSVFIGMLVLAAPGEAQAHARLVKSSPTSGTDLAQSPGKIELWFNELLDGNFDSIAVFPAADVGSKTRVNLVSEDAKVDEKDRTHLTVVIKPLPPGEYAVEWRVLSLDGHTATGRFKFKVIPAK